MKIQFLNGGLANQVFQYIFARGYELSHPGYAMYLDDSYFGVHTVHNGYELSKVFGLSPHMVSELFDADVWEWILAQKKEGISLPQVLLSQDVPIQMIAEADTWKHYNPFDGKVMPIPSNEYYPEIYDFPGDVYYHGYWINENWWLQNKDIFIQELLFPDIPDQTNQKHLDTILHTPCVAIHIRRGDYVTLDWALNASQYRRNIEAYLAQYGNQFVAFVFSDDIPWCKDHYKELSLNSFTDTIFVEGNTEGNNYIDLQLMSQCEGMILSNSAFSYLGALLNKRLTYCINPSKIRRVTLAQK